MAKHPIVSECRVSKTMFGGWKLTFDCPACQSELTTKEEAIGTLDDCPNCGAQFHVSQRVGEQIAALEAEADGARREAESRKKEEEAARRRKDRELEAARRQEELRERKTREQREISRGYDYPNLRKYQSSLETTAIIGAILFCLLGLASILGGVAAINLANGEWTVAIPFVLGALGCFAAAASWYFWWMVVAELIRLTITVALDVRAIRDNGSGSAED